MTLQDLGALGETVAAVGVIISLVYLAFQIRLSAKSNTVTTIQELQRDLREVLSMPDDRLLTAMMKDRAREPLTREEESNVGRDLVAQLRVYEAMWFAFEQGLLPETVLNGYLWQCAITLGSDRNRTRWNDELKHHVHPGFATYVDAYLDSNPHRWSSFDWIDNTNG